MGIEMNFDATRQALNFVIQSEGSSIGQSSVRFQDMSDTYQIGQFHLRHFSDVSRPRRLVEIVGEVSRVRGELGFRNWLVKDVLSGMAAKVSQTKLSPDSYNEMEVLAWASR